MDIKQSFCLKPLPLDALNDLDCLLSNSMTDSPNNITQLLKNCEFFREKFRLPIDLEEFAQLAKSAATHETHNYGTILLKENDDIEKFYLLIEGRVEKIRRKPQPQNLTLSFDLISSHGQTKGTENSNRIRRSRPSVRIEESSFSHKRPSRMSFFSPAEKDLASLPMIKPLLEKRVVRPSILSSSFRSPTTMNTTAELDSSGSKKTLRFCDESPMSCHKSSINIINETERGSELNQAEQELMEFACKDDVELHKRYYCEGNLIATKVKSYRSGSFLGENPAIVTLQKSSSSMLVVSSKKAHFLAFSRDNLNAILTILENKAQEKLETFTNIFPSLNTKFIKRFSGYFQQKHYQMNETIYSQDDNTKDLYFLCSGEVKLIKASPNQEHEIPIVTIMNGQFFGEEALLDREARQETAVANAQSTLVYVFNGDLYDSLKTSFSNFWDILTSLAQEKFSWRKAKETELFELERNTPRGLLTYTPHKRTFTSANRSQKLSQSTDKRKSSSFYYRQSFLSETSPISSSEVSKISEDSPTSRVTEQYKSQFSRTIVFCKNGNEPQAVDLKKPHNNCILPALEFEDWKLENELNVSVNRKKSNNFSSRETSPRKVRVEKDPILIQCNSVENMQKEAKSSLFNHAKKAIIKAGRKSKKYIPTFMPMKNLNVTEGEVDLNNFKIDPSEEPVKKLPTRRDAENNSVKMLIRRIKIH